jgi:hypothetical protein
VGLLDLHRNTSVGSFLKSELFQEQYELKPAMPCVKVGTPRSQRYRDSSDQSDVEFHFVSGLPQSANGATQQPRRRLSKSKKLMLKAAGTFNTVRSKSANLLNHGTSSQSIGEYTPSKSRETSTYIPPGNLSSPSGTTLEGNILDGYPVLPTPNFVLYPQIRVVPSTASVDSAKDQIIWAAIKITAVLVNGAVNTTGSYGPAVSIHAPNHQLGRFSV